MRRSLTNLWVATLVVLVPLFFANYSQAEKPRTAKSAGEWQKGKTLSSSEEQHLRLYAGTSIRLAANSTTEVLGKIPMPTSMVGLGPYADTARLIQGRLDVSVDPKKGPANALLVYGPKRTSVLATSGVVSIVAFDNSLAVGVYEGKEAAVSIGSTWKHIPAGSMLVVSAQTPDGEQSLLPTTPTQVTVTRPVLAVTGLNDPSSAVWQTLSNAKGYRVALRDTRGDKTQYLETEIASIKLTGLVPGRYELRVATLAEYGLASAYSEPVYVNVVGIELPPGGYFSGGKALMEPGQQIKLSHVEGLEMTYDGSPYYFAAVARTGLNNGQSSTVHFRLPGAQERASLTLAPRSLETAIEVTPTLARWPRDKVHVVVHLPKALAQSTNLEFTTAVTVNSKPVELRWVRTADSLEAVLASPPVYPGPWVLRATVFDQFGNLLGRNFLEIASMAGQKDEDLPIQIHRGTITVQAKR